MPKNPFDPNNVDYEVGYGKPPKRTQFKPGQSGNVRGRTKKVSTVLDELRAILSAKVAVQQDGQKKRVSKRRVILEQIINGAANKDKNMLRLAIPLIHLSDSAPAFSPLPEDEKALNTIKKLLESDDGDER